MSWFNAFKDFLKKQWFLFIMLGVLSLVFLLFGIL